MIKNTYKVIEFESQKGFALYMMNSILDDTMYNIFYAGKVADLNIIELKTIKSGSYKNLRIWITELTSEWIVIKKIKVNRKKRIEYKSTYQRKYTDGNDKRSKYKKEYFKKKKEMNVDDSIQEKL